MTKYRIEESMNVRNSAAKLAADRVHPQHKANGDEERYATANYLMNFTKGLEHNSDTGLIDRAQDFLWFRNAIDEGKVDAFTLNVRAANDKERAWEAPTAGIVYELEGPDPQAVTMPPAPALGSIELAYEMAEVYELAVLRDVELTRFSDANATQDIVDSVDRLNGIGFDLSGANGARPRKNVAGDVTPQTVFRGSSPGVEIGPYLSQFMIIGNETVTGDTVADGRIAYGALTIDQRVPVANPQNYMTEWEDWLDVQNGRNVRDNATLFDASAARRFITFPRDIATYVHDDALYEAYLNACLILLGMGTPFDPGFDKLSGGGEAFLNSLNINSQFEAVENFEARRETHRREAGGFALWGGPHILTLVTEVATRALKAVRYQKFNTHCRLRPEALAARIHRANEIQTAFQSVGSRFTDLANSINPTLSVVRSLNPNNEALLPMAFQEGSPMHPSYGAGHATVAGACVTILKAFFDTSAVFVRRDGREMFARYQDGDVAVEYTPLDDGSALNSATGNAFLTLEGELNKLAANISIGRNMAGVHYFSDDYDSLRMGEEIAIGILEEQAICYPTDPFVMSVPTFDGDVRRIGKL